MISCGTVVYAASFEANCTHLGEQVWSLNWGESTEKVTVELREFLNKSDSITENFKISAIDLNSVTLDGVGHTLKISDSLYLDGMGSDLKCVTVVSSLDLMPKDGSSLDQIRAVIKNLESRVESLEKKP